MPVIFFPSIFLYVAIVFAGQSEVRSHADEELFQNPVTRGFVPKKDTEPSATRASLLDSLSRLGDKNSRIGSCEFNLEIVSGQPTKVTGKSGTLTADPHLKISLTQGQKKRVEMISLDGRLLERRQTIRDTDQSTKVEFNGFRRDLWFPQGNLSPVAPLLEINSPILSSTSGIRRNLRLVLQLTETGEILKLYFRTEDTPKLMALEESTRQKHPSSDPRRSLDAAAFAEVQQSAKKANLLDEVNCESPKRLTYQGVSRRKFQGDEYSQPREIKRTKKLFGI